MVDLCRLDRALETALKKVQLIEAMEDTMVLELPGALGEYCEIAAHLRRKGAREKHFMKKAAMMARQFGDIYVYNHEERVKEISKIG